MKVNSLLSSGIFCLVSASFIGTSPAMAKDFCYMVKANGQYVDLTALCQKDNQINSKRGTASVSAGSRPQRNTVVNSVVIIGPEVPSGNGVSTTRNNSLDSSSSTNPTSNSSTNLTSNSSSTGLPNNSQLNSPSEGSNSGFVNSNQMNPTPNGFNNGVTNSNVNPTSNSSNNGNSSSNPASNL